MNTGVVFDTYKIRSPYLSEYIQYVLFNYSGNAAENRVVTSFANTNICLGIVREKELYEKEDGTKATRHKPGIHSYLSGMYLQPHRFELSGTLDEICIDFTPAGYYRFFRFPAKTYIFNEDILTEGLGKDAGPFFERVFEQQDFQARGAMIEQYLLSKLRDTGIAFTEQCLYYIHASGGAITLRDLAGQLQCSEKKIVRTFLQNFDLTPKDYMRIVRFRKTLNTLNNSTKDSLTSIGYDGNYFDQSHFIKDFRFFTGKTPNKIRQSIVDVKQNVIIGVE